MKYPVFITSKGRATTRTTTVPNSIWVVDPSEVEAYRASGIPTTNILAVPADNIGIAATFNFVKDHASRSGMEKFWMLEDDISTFGRYENKKNISEPGEVILGEAEQLGVGTHLFSLNFCQVAWTSERKRILGKGAYCAVLMDTQATKNFRYSNKLPLKCDIDFSLQLLSCGLTVGVAGWLWFRSAVMGSQEGGLYQTYRSPANDASVAELMRRWPHCLTLTEKHGRADVRIHWSKVRPKEAK